MFWLIVPPASCGMNVVRSVALRIPSFSMSCGRYVSTGFGPVSSAVGIFEPVTTTRSSSAEVVRGVVTGSNIPTAEETGTNPVDTYRPQDIEKLGIRNATDLQEFIPQQAGGTVNLNIGDGGDGTVQFNLRGILPKETLILIDGKRVAYGSLGVAGFSGGVDINLLPFPMI